MFRDRLGLLIGASTIGSGLAGSAYAEYRSQNKFQRIRKLSNTANQTPSQQRTTAVIKQAFQDIGYKGEVHVGFSTTATRMSVAAPILKNEAAVVVGMPDEKTDTPEGLQTSYAIAGREAVHAINHHLHKEYIFEFGLAGPGIIGAGALATHPYAKFVLAGMVMTELVAIPVAMIVGAPILAYLCASEILSEQHKFEAEKMSAEVLGTADTMISYLRKKETEAAADPLDEFHGAASKYRKQIKRLTGLNASCAFFLSEKFRKLSAEATNEAAARASLSHP